MAVKNLGKGGYKEPADYFTAGMLKVAREWDREHEKKQNTSSGSKTDKAKKK